MNAGIDTKESFMNTREIIDRIFKDPATKYELTEFENLGKAVHDILAIYPKTAATGRDAGKTKYYLKSFIPFSSGNEEVQVYVEDGKALDPDITFDRINGLFKKACEEWPGIWRMRISSWPSATCRSVLVPSRACA